MLTSGLLSSSQSYLVALSGGRDSVYLLEKLLAEGYSHLHLVHLNHQLRGAESDEDATFVQNLARKHDLPLTLKTAEVATLAVEHKESIETAARRARHQLFADAARATGCAKVLLAHHADDQAETCLFNLLRGSSGIKAMVPHKVIHNDGQELALIRPLLDTRRSEINTYLAQHQITYRDDSSNNELAYTRNRIRQEVIPLIGEVLQRDCVPSLLRAEQATRESEEIARDLLITLELRDPQGRLFLPKLRTLSHTLQRACVKTYLIENNVPEISRALLEQARELISPKGPPALNLPGNRHLRRREARLFLS